MMGDAFNTSAPPELKVKLVGTGPFAKAPDTLMLYDYLKKFGGVVAPHTSGTGMGTDWRDNDPNLEPVVEIYQGIRQNYEMPGAPRSNSENDSIGRWRPKGFVNLALEMGYKMAFKASSDHISTHMSCPYCGNGVFGAIGPGPILLSSGVFEIDVI